MPEMRRQGGERKESRNVTETALSNKTIGRLGVRSRMRGKK